MAKTIIRDLGSMPAQARTTPLSEAVKIHLIESAQTPGMPPRFPYPGFKVSLQKRPFWRDDGDLGRRRKAARQSGVPHVSRELSPLPSTKASSGRAPFDL